VKTRLIFYDKLQSRPTALPVTLPETYTVPIFLYSVCLLVHCTLYSVW